MRICISMPAYNEADGISDFLRDLFDTFSEFELTILVVNDKSKDETLEVLFSFEPNQVNSLLEILDNTTNLGHGPSTIKGLQWAADREYDYIIAIDGDGQFIANEVLALLQKTVLCGYDVSEGVRTNRTDPKFRKVSTAFTKLLVFLPLGRFPKDANTPLRIYQITFLRQILQSIPQSLLTPNIYISAASRILQGNILEERVTSTVRRGKSSSGTTWKQKFEILPSKRFMSFCMRAFIQYFTVATPNLIRLKSYRAKE